jgi:uncharacterized membrane protein
MSSQFRESVLNIVTSAVIASMYFVLVFALAGISFLPFQVRIADMLVMLPSVVGLPAVYGVTLGCFVANAFAPYGANPIDMSLGSLANLLAGYVVYKLAYKRESYRVLILSSIAASAIITVVVGSYLPVVIGIDASLENVLLIGWVGVLPGELVSVVLLGVPVSKVLKRSFKLWRKSPPS